MTATGTIGAILRHKGAQIWSIPPETRVYDAIRIMADRDIGALLVMAGPRLVGIMSERDYTRKIALKGKSSKETSVSEILSKQILSTTPEHSVEDCMRLMTTGRVRHLPVLDGDRVVGVVSIGDLVNWTISAQSVTIDQLENYISGSYPG